MLAVKQGAAGCVAAVLGGEAHEVEEARVGLALTGAVVAAAEVFALISCRETGATLAGTSREAGADTVAAAEPPAAAGAGVAARGRVPDDTAASEFLVATRVSAAGADADADVAAAPT